jgi:hypothetical protein
MYPHFTISPYESELNFDVFFIKKELKIERKKFNNIFTKKNK